MHKLMFVGIAVLGTFIGTAAAGTIMSPDRARHAAIRILLGDPYGNTPNEVLRTIKEQKLIARDYDGCGASRARPGYRFEIVVKDRPNGKDPIEGFLVIDARTGKLACAGLPFLD